MKKYTNVVAFFLPHQNPKLEERVREACEFLEVMLNSQMFLDFVMEAPYIAEEPREDIYERYLSGEVRMVFEIKPAVPNINAGFSVNKNSRIISVYEENVRYGIPEMAAILSHEYGHIVGFDHPRGTAWAGSFSYYLQYEGEKIFRKFYRKLKGKDYPRKGKWLVYEPWCKLLWFWKVLKWK